MNIHNVHILNKYNFILLIAQKLKSIIYNLNYIKKKYMENHEFL